MYSAVFARCGAITHLNLFDLRTLVREFTFFHALFGPPEPAPNTDPQPDNAVPAQRSHSSDALTLVSAEWSDPQQNEEGPPIERALELVQFFCAVPSTCKLLLLLSAHWGFHTRAAAGVRATRTWDLMRPLKSSKVFVALHSRVYGLWAGDIDQKETYEALGEQVSPELNA